MVHYYEQTDASRKFFELMLKQVTEPKHIVLLESLHHKDELTIEEYLSLIRELPHNRCCVLLLHAVPKIKQDPPYKASAEFRQKTEALRRKFEAQEYNKLVESVDPAQSYGATPLLADFGADLRSMNRQLGTMINFVITVVGGFFFGFTGITYAYPSYNFDLATRFMIGLVLATIIFFADLYFVVKNMDEELAARPTAAKPHAVPLDLRKLGAPITPKSDAQKKTD